MRRVLDILSWRSRRWGGSPPPPWLIWLTALVIFGLITLYDLKERRIRWAAEAEFEALCLEQEMEIDCEARVDEDGITCFNHGYIRGRRGGGGSLNWDRYERCLTLGIVAYKAERAAMAEEQRRKRKREQQERSF